MVELTVTVVDVPAHTGTADTLKLVTSSTGDVA